VGDGDSGIDEEEVVPALARERGLDLVPPLRERGAPEKLGKDSGKRPAGVEEDPFGSQELVDHGGPRSV
jgi:hypothetical protein